MIRERPRQKQSVLAIMAISSIGRVAAIELLRRCHGDVEKVLRIARLIRDPSDAMIAARAKRAATMARAEAGNRISERSRAAGSSAPAKPAARLADRASLR